MGMFTTILHPEDQRELQIKTGQDECFTYKIGDTLPWTPNPWYPGDHIDGVYDACSRDDNDCWVVIKDCKVVAVEPKAARSDFELQSLVRQHLEHKYRITPPDPALWTKKQWDDQAARKAKAEAEFKAAVKKHGGDVLAAAAGLFIAKKLKEKSFASRIMAVRKT